MGEKPSSTGVGRGRKGQAGGRGRERALLVDTFLDPVFVSPARGKPCGPVTRATGTACSASQGCGNRAFLGAELAWEPGHWAGRAEEGMG